MTPSALLTELRLRFVAQADTARAAQQAAYMKSAMPFHGLANTAVRATCKAVFASYPFDDAPRWRADVRALWHGATHREERYAAIELSEDRRARVLQGLPRTARAAVPPNATELAREATTLFAELIVSGAWWDYVDAIAAHRIGPLLLQEPTTLRPIVLAWAHGDDLWLRRAAIIAQLGAKGATDRTLLADCIAPALGDASFWLRKAIGWALRELAKTQPAWVRAYVATHEARLSPLSRREALKGLA
jgi:3-methyladenine DNA glycosylase AlkD